MVVLRFVEHHVLRGGFSSALQLGPMPIMSIVTCRHRRRPALLGTNGIVDDASVLRQESFELGKGP